MFRYKLIFILLLSASNCFAADAAEEVGGSNKTENVADYGSNNQFDVSFGIVSWQEQLTVNNASNSDWGSATFTGNAIGLQWQQTWSDNAKHAGLLDVEGMAGSVTATDGGKLISYQNSVSWAGAMVGYRYMYRLTPLVAFAAGPVVLARQVSYPSSGGISATSGSGANYGYQVEMRAHVIPHLMAQVSLGNLIQSAGPIWSLALSYLF